MYSPKVMKKFRTPPLSPSPEKNEFHSNISSWKVESPNENKPDYSFSLVKDMTQRNTLQSPTGKMMSLPSPRALRDRLKSLGIADITNVPVASPNYYNELDHVKSVAATLETNEQSAERDERETYRRRLHNLTTETSSEKTPRINQLEHMVVDKVQKLSTLSDKYNASVEQKEDLSRINRELQEQLELLNQTHSKDHQTHLFVEKQVKSLQAEMISWKNYSKSKDSDIDHLSHVIEAQKHENDELTRKLVEFENRCSANERELHDSRMQNKLFANKIEVLERLMLEANMSNAQFSNIFHLANEKLERVFPNAQMRLDLRGNMHMETNFEHWLNTIISTIERLKYENAVRDAALMDRESFILELQRMIEKESRKISQHSKQDDPCQSDELIEDELIEEDTLSLDDSSKFLLISKIRKTFGNIITLQDGLNHCRSKVSEAMNIKTETLCENDKLKSQINQLSNKIVEERAYRDSIEEKLDDACQQLVHFVSLNDELNHEVTIQSRLNSALREEIDCVSKQSMPNDQSRVHLSPDFKITKENLDGIAQSNDLVASFFEELQGSCDFEVNNENATSPILAVVQYTRWLQEAYNKELEKNINLQDEISAAAAVFTATAVEVFSQRRELTLLCENQSQSHSPQSREQETQKTITSLIDEAASSRLKAQNDDVDILPDARLPTSHNNVSIDLASTSINDDNFTDPPPCTNDTTNECENEALKLRAILEDETSLRLILEAEMKEKQYEEAHKITSLTNELQVRDDMIAQLKMELTDLRIQAYKFSSLTEELQARDETIDRLKVELTDETSRRLLLETEMQEKQYDDAHELASLTNELQVRDDMIAQLKMELTDLRIQAYKVSSLTEELQARDETIDRLKVELLDIRVQCDIKSEKDGDSRCISQVPSESQSHSPQSREQETQQIITSLTDISTSFRLMAQNDDVDILPGARLPASLNNVSIDLVSTSVNDDNANDPQPCTSDTTNECENEALKLRAILEDKTSRRLIPEAELQEKQYDEAHKLTSLTNELQVRDVMIAQLKMELTDLRIQAYKFSSLTEELQARDETIDRLKVELLDIRVQCDIKSEKDGDSRCISQVPSADRDSEFETEMQKIIENELEDVVKNLRDRDEIIIRLNDEVTKCVNKNLLLRQELDHLKSTRAIQRGESKLGPDECGNLKDDKVNSNKRDVDIAERRNILFARDYESPVITEISREEDSVNNSVESQYSRLSTLEEKFSQLSDEMLRLQVHYPPSHSSPAAVRQKKRRNRRASALINNYFPAHEVEEAEI